MSILKTVIFSAVCHMACSCSNVDSALSEAVSEWTGKELHFPSEMTFMSLGETPVEVDLDKKYKILHYVDAQG